MHLWKIIYTPYKKHLAGQPGELLNGGPRLGSASGSVPPQTYALPRVVILQILASSAVIGTLHVKSHIPVYEQQVC